MSEHKWLKELQTYAQRCTFWGFSCHYPWLHPCVPKNMKDNMTLMSDGFPMLRLKVLEGGKRYRLLQYYFPRMFNDSKIASESGLLLRAMQKSIWKQSWDADITQKQLHEYMRLVGRVSCGEMREIAKLVEAGEEIPFNMMNKLAVDVQERHKKALDKG